MTLKLACGPIPFHLGDPAGIVFFSHALTLAHTAYEQMISQHFLIPWDEWFCNPSWVAPIKEAHAQYKSPLLCGRNHQVVFQLLDLHPTEFSLSASIFQEKLCAIITTTHVSCSRNPLQRSPLPQHFFDHLLSLR